MTPIIPGVYNSRSGKLKILKGANEKITFSKLTMSIIFVLFIIGAIIGGILVVVSAKHDISLGLQIDSGMFIAYATYLGAPTATAIGFYAWKSKAENIIKIRQSFNRPSSETTDPTEILTALTNMEGAN